MNKIANCQLQNENCKLSGRGPRTPQISNRRSPISDLKSVRRRGFTLVELLVVIIIIGLMASVVLGALAKTREVARADATKATITKLNDLVMRKYESYMTRRLPIPMTYSNLNPLTPADAARVRLSAIRDLMRMEMPERWLDINQGPLPINFTSAQGTVNTALNAPALQKIYYDKYHNFANYGMGNPANADPNHQQAKCLYLWVMTAIPEAKSTFGGSEIADVDGDGWKMFVDGWGKPIGFLRWAPGATMTLDANGAPYQTLPTSNAANGWSDVQIDDTLGANLHHDPFDPTLIENKQPGSAYPNAAAYHLYPLIFAGVVGQVSFNGILCDDYGIALGNGVTATGDFDISKLSPAAPTLDPFASPYINGQNTNPPSVGAVLSGVPLVHNQHMEQK